MIIKYLVGSIVAVSFVAPEDGFRVPLWVGWIGAAAVVCLLLGALILLRIWRKMRKNTSAIRALYGGLGRELSERNDRKDREDLIFNVTSEVSATTGESFFQELGRYLARATGCCLALVVAHHDEEDRPGLRTLAVYLDGRPCPDFEYNPIGTPCEPVMKGQCCICLKDAWKVYTICDQVRALLLMESDVGTPLLDSSGQVMGLLALCHRGTLWKRSGRTPTSTW